MRRVPRSRSMCGLLGALLVLTACGEQPTDLHSSAPGPASRPSFAILDGAHGGNPSFFFLPPLVPAPSYSGVFDGSLSPTVEVCELAGATCGAVVATFSAGQVKADPKNGAYVATWKTKGAGLDPARTYRIQVLLPTPFGTRELGYADVVVLANGGQVKTVDGDQFVAVINGGVVPIRFRIEGGATPSGWQLGDMLTAGQDDWGVDQAGIPTVLFAHFNSLYASTFGVLEIGVPGPAGFSIIFSSGRGVYEFLRASGEPGALDADLSDPTSSASGAFGPEVAALQINVDYADAGILRGRSKTRFGDLTLCNLAALPALNGLSVRQFLGTVNTLLGGGSGTYAIAELHPVTADLNAAFAEGSASAFALQHLGNGSCASAPWHQGDFVTHTRQAWTTGVLEFNYDLLYASTFGILEVGLPGAAGFSIGFSSAIRVINYLPASGAPGPLDADLSDPTSTASGIFGGEVTALQLNVDFAHAGLLVGAAGIPIGDLTVCGLSALPLLNGMTVRQVLGTAHTALGGGSTSYGIPELAGVVGDLNSSFYGGLVSPFARDHLVSGACP